MNAVTEGTQLTDQTKLGLYHKFNVTRTDGSSEPGGKHHDDEYFVLNLTTDKHAMPALAAYAEACAVEYPALAADLRKKIVASSLVDSEFVLVPESKLPNGHVEPAFLVARYLSSKGPAGIPQSTPAGEPWIEIDYHDARAACESAGLKLITELQWLALAHDIANQDANWTGGKVGEGSIYQGLHKDTVSSAQPGNYESTDPEERRWFVLSNGEKVFDFAGNAYSWVFDNVQGDDAGLVAQAFAADSPSIATAPYPSMEKGVGWIPKASSGWSGSALIRGGCWSSGGDAGVFYLGGGWPDDGGDFVSFRCTKSLG